MYFTLPACASHDWQGLVWCSPAASKQQEALAAFAARHVTLSVSSHSMCWCCWLPRRCLHQQAQLLAGSYQMLVFGCSWLTRMGPLVSGPIRTILLPGDAA